jgi:hypothetical protein
MDTYVMTKKKRGRPRKNPLLLSTSQQPCQSEDSQLLNRITEVPEEIPTNGSPENPSGTGLTEPSATSAGIDPFEAAVNEVGSELGGEFAQVASSAEVVASAAPVVDAQIDIDVDAWIREIATSENAKLYIELPFEGVALITQKPHLALKKHEVVLLSPIVRKWCESLLKSSDNPEFAAFMIFLMVYGSRIGAIEALGGLQEWLPKLQSILGLGTSTQD